MRRVERVPILAHVRTRVWQLLIAGLASLASLAFPDEPADKTVTLLFTNDVESAYDPTLPFGSRIWR